jgi:hypothetical protein
MEKMEHSFSYYLYKINVRCAIGVQFRLTRMKIETAQPAVQCCADVHFFMLIRTGVSRRECTQSDFDINLLPVMSYTMQHYRSNRPKVDFAIQVSSMMY